MFISLGEIAMAGPVKDDRFARRSLMPGRSDEPVRRHSILKGREGLLWQRTTRAQVRQIVLAARKFDVAERQPGERNGPLGHVALEVLDYLANLIDWRTGRLDPAITHLMEKLKRSRDAIVRALDALRRHGFLDWQRRYKPTGNEGRGPQVQQTSNAYRLHLPERARRLLGRLLQQPPLPDDHSHAQEQRKAEAAAYRASLSLAEVARHEVDDDGLAAVLARLGEHVQRESAKQTESSSKDISYRDRSMRDAESTLSGR